MDASLVTVGIVTWNSAEFLKPCLESLAQQDYPAIELVVVDNASADHSASLAADLFPSAKIICNSTNRGFCGGHNQAIRSSQGAYYLPLNPDVVLEPGYVSAAVGAMESGPRVGMVAARLFLGCKGDLPRRLDSTGLFVDRRRRQYLRGHGEPDGGQYDQPEEVFGVDGAAPLYRREMLDDISVQGEAFDEAFFAHKEDVDLCWRARLLGWRCIYTPHAAAFHQRTFRPGKREKIAEEIRLNAVKNRYLMLLKNEIPEGWKRDWLSILWYDAKILGYLVLFERKSLKALGLVWDQRRRVKSWRTEIMQKKRVAASELLAWFR